METENNKISIKQLVTMFLISVASPIIRIMAKYCSEIAKDASWVTPIVAIIPFLGLLYVLNTVVCKNNNDSLEDVFNRVFGKIIGKIITIIYILWIFIIIATYLRFFADRMTSSIYVLTPNSFFIATMLFVVYIAARKDLKFFARYVEIFGLIFMTFMIVSFAISIPNIKIVNLLPVTTKDIGSIALSTYPVLGIGGYITFMFFLGNMVSNKQEFKSHFKKMCTILVVAGLIVILLTVGIFGTDLVQNLNMPFFISFKNIEILNIFERLESVLITFWTVTDFVIITTFTYIGVKLIKKTFNLNSSKEIVTPFLFICFILSLYIASNVEEVNLLSKYTTLPVNVIFSFVIPIILLIVGKIRKKI